MSCAAVPSPGCWLFLLSYLHNSTTFLLHDKIFCQFFFIQLVDVISTWTEFQFKGMDRFGHTCQFVGFNSHIQLGKLSVRTEIGVLDSFSTSAPGTFCAFWSASSRSRAPSLPANKLSKSVCRKGTFANHVHQFGFHSQYPLHRTIEASTAS